MPRSPIFVAVLPAIVFTIAHAQCAGGDAAPVDPATIGKKAHSYKHCRVPGGFRYSSFLEIHNWGISWTPLYYHGRVFTIVCPEEIVSVFRRKDMPAVLTWTSEKHYEDFPELNKKRMAGNHSIRFPCASQKVDV